MQNEILLNERSNRYIWVQLRNNGGLFGGAAYLCPLLRHFNEFSFKHAPMIIKVDNKVMDSLDRIYLNE